jgi:6-phosphogluconolactonase
VREQECRVQEKGKALTALYVSVGRELSHYHVRLGTASLVEQSRLTLPYKVQYVWPHPSAPYLYAACSNGAPDARGDAHCAVVLRIDRQSGALQIHGTPVALPSRPIHITVDGPGKHVLTAYNDPSSVTVHRIESDGRSVHE